MNHQIEQNHPSIKMVRQILDTWQFWIVLAYVVLAFVGFKVYTNNQDTQEALQRSIKEQTIRLVTEKGNNTAAVNVCFVTVKNQPVVRGFIESQRTIIRNSILSTQAALAVTDITDPLHKTRVTSLERLKKSLANSERLNRLQTENTKTREECVQLAKKLHIAIPKQFQKKVENG